jgi:hypothetical protein
MMAGAFTSVLANQEKTEWLPDTNPHMYGVVIGREVNGSWTSSLLILLRE